MRNNSGGAYMVRPNQIQSISTAAQSSIPAGQQMNQVLMNR